MKTDAGFPSTFVAVAVAAALTVAGYTTAAAHCDTMDGPVVMDARKALDTKDVTPVLKWVRQKDEKIVRAAFTRTLAAKGKNAASAEKEFFSTVVKVHRAAEGEKFTGLKPAGAVEPAVAETDRALGGGSPDALVKMVTDAVADGIRERYRRAAEAYRHKDESVAAGREFVEAYVDLTHYVERVHADAASGGGHGDHGDHGVKHAPAVHHRH